MLLGIISITLLMLILMLSIAPLRNFLSFEEVEATLVVKAAALGFFSVIWFEGYKAYWRMKA